MGIKYLVNENFFDAWTPVMAYVLGFIYADGTLIDDRVSRGKYLSITSTDEDIILKIKLWLNSGHSITAQRPNWPNGKEKFVLRIGSSKLYNSLLQLGLYPNKSLTITLPEIPHLLLKDFVRGYFDGDGCAYLERKLGITRPLIIKKLTTIFTSGSREFLEKLMKDLQGVAGIHQNRIYDSQRSFQLRMSTSDSIKLFKFMYSEVPEGAYFKRKYDVFKQYFTMRPASLSKHELYIRIRPIGAVVK